MSSIILVSDSTDLVRRVRLAARDVDPDIVHELSTAEVADYKVDETSGHLIFRIKGTGHDECLYGRRFSSLK